MPSGTYSPCAEHFIACLTHIVIVHTCTRTRKQFVCVWLNKAVPSSNIIKYIHLLLPFSHRMNYAMLFITSLFIGVCFVRFEPFTACAHHRAENINASANDDLQWNICRALLSDQHVVADAIAAVAFFSFSRTTLVVRTKSLIMWC